MLIGYDSQQIIENFQEILFEVVERGYFSNSVHSSGTLNNVRDWFPVYNQPVTISINLSFDAGLLIIVGELMSKQLKDQLGNIDVDLNTAVPLPLKQTAIMPTIVNADEVGKMFIQLYNSSGDPFFLDMNTGQGYWILPAHVPLSSVKYIAHISDDGRLYYENIRDPSSAVSWELPPRNEMCDAVKAVAGELEIK